MRKKIVISLIIVGALAIAGAAVAFAYQPVSAAVQQLSEPGGMMFAGKGPGGWYTSEELAKALGIDVAALTAANTKAKEAMIAQAVKDGVLTQAQADEILKNAGKTPLVRDWQGTLARKGLNYDKFLADALGITVEKLQAAYKTAAAEHIAQNPPPKMSQEQTDLMKARAALNSNAKYQAAMKAAYEAALKQAVSDGVITQAQADLLLKEQAAPKQPVGGFPRGGGRGK